MDERLSQAAKVEASISELEAEGATALGYLSQVEESWAQIMKFVAEHLVPSQVEPAQSVVGFNDKHMRRFISDFKQYAQLTHRASNALCQTLDKMDLIIKKHGGGRYA